MNDRRRNTFRIDYDKLAEAIVKAELQVNDELKKKEEIEFETLRNEWNNILGFNDELTGLKKLRNNFKTVWNIVTFKKENIRNSAANNALLKLVLQGIYLLFEFILYAAVVIGVGVTILSFVQGFVGWGFIAIAIITFIFFIARIIRIARFEIEIIDDKNYLVALFSAVTAFVAIIVSVVAIVISVKYTA